MDLLWTNANPTSAFDAQKISIDLSDYKFAYIIFKVAIDVNEYVSKLYKIGLGMQFCMAMNPQPRYRHIDVYNNSIVFHRGYLVTGITTENSDLNQMIPYQIYGVK